MWPEKMLFSYFSRQSLAGKGSVTLHGPINIGKQLLKKQPTGRVELRYADATLSVAATTALLHPHRCCILRCCFYNCFAAALGRCIAVGIGLLYVVVPLIVVVTTALLWPAGKLRCCYHCCMVAATRCCSVLTAILHMHKFMIHEWDVLQELQDLLAGDEGITHNIWNPIIKERDWHLKQKVDTINKEMEHEMMQDLRQVARQRKEQQLTEFRQTFSHDGSDTPKPDSTV